MIQLEESVSTTIVRRGSNIAKISSLTKSYFRSQKLFSYRANQINGASRWVSLISGRTISEQLLINYRQKLAKPRNPRTPFTIVGASHLSIAYTFSGSILMPSPARTINPRYFVSIHPNSHFLRSRCSPTSRSLERTFLTCSQCSLISPSEQIKISSRYTEQKSSRYSRSAQLIYFQKELGALARLKGVTSYSQSPYLVRKAVFHSSPLATRIL